MPDKSEKVEALRTAVVLVRGQQRRMEQQECFEDNEFVQQEYNELEHHFSTLLKMENNLSESLTDNED